MAHDASVSASYTYVLDICIRQMYGSAMDTMTNRNILISGASVAGPALAYWLSRRGFTPTVVERAPGLRGGGYAVDFRGAVHLGFLEKMGILDEIRAHQTHLRSTVYVDSEGRA